MTPLDTFRSLWLPQERRALRHRRAVDERRQGAGPVTVERRQRPSRRYGIDRRESASGHLRNALQVLQQLTSDTALTSDQKEKVDSSVRRLWLAVAELERPRGSD